VVGQSRMIPAVLEERVAFSMKRVCSTQKFDGSLVLGGLLKAMCRSAKSVISSVRRLKTRSLNCLGSRGDILDKYTRLTTLSRIKQANFMISVFWPNGVLLLQNAMSN
jgi:hypothetical protein